MKYSNEQQSRGQQVSIFGKDGYIWDWSQATFENWQSEFLQLLSFVLLTSFLIHKGSHESKDGDEEMKALIVSLHERLHKIEKRLPDAELASDAEVAAEPKVAPVSHIV